MAAHPHDSPKVLLRMLHGYSTLTHLQLWDKPCALVCKNPCIAKEDAKYDALPETAKIDVSNDYVMFSRTFKYLGLKILHILCNNDDIKAHIAAALQSMGALKEEWRNQHLDTYSKYLLFCVIPMNLLLWGCENWSLQQDLLCRLKVFLH
jgi:hypothetical protein